MSSKTSVINLLQLPGGSESQQVMLQVRIAEVNRRAVQELGVTLFSTRPEATGGSPRSSSRRRVLTTTRADSFSAIS
jgi:Flp pilus assembly secretin CpaC